MDILSQQILRKNKIRMRQKIGYLESKWCIYYITYTLVPLTKGLLTLSRHLDCEVSKNKQHGVFSLESSVEKDHLSTRSSTYLSP